MKLGAVDFLQKPFSPAEIRDLVRKVLDRDALRTEEAARCSDHVEPAKKAIAEHRLEAAREHLRQAVGADPVKPEAHNLLGLVAEILGDKREAAGGYRAPLALDASYEPARQNLYRVTGAAADGSPPARRPDSAPNLPERQR